MGPSEHDGKQRTGLRVAFLVCLFLSGVAGLIYEVVWTRQLLLVFGTTTFAISTVLTAFMAGLGLGAFLFGRIVDRWQRPLLLYGLLELLIGLYALLVPQLFLGLVPVYRIIWQGFAPSFSLFSFLRFLLAFAVLFIPTTLMGGTLPALSRFYAKKQETIGLNVGLLYGLNTLGAVLGAAAAGFLLLPEVGMKGTTWAAVTLNLAVGLFALVVAAKEMPLKKGIRPVRQWEPSPALHEFLPGTLPPSLVWAALATFGLSGFIAMTYEVAWTRLFTLVLGSSTYAFTTMLVPFLTGLALGDLLMAKVVDRLPRPLLILAFLQLGIGLSALFGQRFFGELPLLYLLLFRSFSGQPNLLLASQSLLAFLVMVVPTLLMGAVFPIVIRIYTDNLVKVGRLVGNAYAVNTIGTVTGSFASGFLLLPTLGIQGTIALAIGVNLFLGLLLIFLDQWKGSAASRPSVGGEIGSRLPKGRLLAGAGGATAFVLFVAVVYPPAWDPQVMTSGIYKEAPLFLRLYPSPREVFRRITSQFKLLFYREGIGATVSVTERPSLEYSPHLSLAIDGKVDASTAADMPTQLLSGHLPFLIGEKVERVLVIGLASGMTAGAVAEHPVKAITVVEIEPAVVEASRLFDAFNHRPLEDPRINLIVEDGRNYLLATKERFDAIISEPSNPWMSGPAKLFTKEFFDLGKERLTERGVFVQWLQLYGLEPFYLKALMRTFHLVFPYLLVLQTSPGDLLLLGSGTPLEIDVKRLALRMSVPKIASDLARVGVRDPLDLFVKFRLGSKEIDAYVGLNGPLNTDDNGLIEFAAPKSLYLETAGANLEAMRQASSGITSYIRNLGSKEEHDTFYTALAKQYLSLDLLEEAERLILAGQPLTKTASGYWLSGEICLKRGQEELALDAWYKALGLDPSHFDTLLSLSLFFHHRGKPHEAQPYLRTLVQRYPSNPLVLFYHGLNRYLLGDRTQSASALSLSLQASLQHSEAIDPYFRLKGLGEAPLARYYLSLVFTQLNQPTIAAEYHKSFLKDLETWREDLEQKPTDLSSVSPHLLFRFHLDRGIRFKEEARLAELVRRYVGVFLVSYYKGTTLLFLGYPQEAILELTAAVGSLPGPSARSLAHYYLGLAYRAVGVPDQSLLYLQRFLEAFGDQPDQLHRAATATRNIDEISFQHPQHPTANGSVKGL